MRLALPLCLALSLTACGKYQNEPVTPATRQQTVFTYGDRPMTLIWSGQTNAIVPRTNSKVLFNRDVTGIATITYETGPTLQPSDIATIVSAVLNCTAVPSQLGYGQDGPRNTASARIHCRPET